MSDLNNNFFFKSAAGIVTAALLFLGGMLAAGEPATKPAGVPLAPVFDAMAWCQKSPAPVVVLLGQSPNGDSTWQATRGKEAIQFTKTTAYEQTAALYYHPVIQPGAKVAEQVSEPIDLFKEAQVICFPDAFRVPTPVR